MEQLTTYLKNLTFDNKLKDSLFGKYVQNTRLVILVVLLIILSGIYSYTKIPRVLNPKINIPIVNIITMLPGASPDDIESLVTIPIEDSVSGLDKVKTVTSSSQDSVSAVTLEFESGVDADKAKADVQSAVDSVSTLPANAQTPKVTKLDFENEPVWTFSLSSQNDTLSLVRFGKILRDNIKNLPSVDRVETTGLDDEEIQITIDQQKMASYGINSQTIMQLIQTTTGAQPAGSITTKNSSFVLSLDPTVTSVETLRKLKISLDNNTSVLLSSIATIQRRMKPDAAPAYLASKTQKPIETIRFDVYKTSSANITKAVADAKDEATRTTKLYGTKFIVSSVLNSGDEIDKQFFDLVRDLLVTVALVFVTLFLFLGLRQAIVASAAIPLTFLFTFLVMNLTGISLSFIAFFSLLLSLGLLVDDTIVVISAVTAYYRTDKFTPLEAALLVWRDFSTAITTTTLTTVWAFVPLLLSTGIIGEFIKPIPIVVSSALLGSFIVAVFVTLPFIVLFLNSHLPYRVVVLFRILGFILLLVLFNAFLPNSKEALLAIGAAIVALFVFFVLRIRQKQKQNTTKTKPMKGENKILQELQNSFDHGIIPFHKIEKKYRAIMDTILAKAANRRKTIGIVVIFSLFSFLLLPFGFVRNEFFPSSDENYLYLSLELPQGTQIQKTKQEMLSLLNQLRTIPEVSFVTGTQKLGVDPGRGFSGSGENTALLTLVLPERNQRKRSSMEISEALRTQYAQYAHGTISVVEVSGGPPAGSDLQIKLSGEDLKQIDAYANKIQAYMKKQSTINDPTKSIKSGTSKIVFVPDYQKLLDADITQDQVGQALRIYASGFTLKKDAKLQAGSNENQDIVLRIGVTPQSTNELNTVTISTKNGPVLLNSLGHFVLRPNPSLITREDGKRTISVSASVKKSASAQEENKKLEKFADSLKLLDGYSWSTGGANEENQNSVNSIIMAMGLSFLLIIITMVLQFNSFRKALIVMLVIPLSISGVFIVFGLTQTPLSFPALIGVLALFGIVVKNAILIVDKINQNLKENMPFAEAIADGAESRLEPIALTTFATIIGLTPITLSDPTWQGLGGAIIAGLFFSGSLMLFFIPVMYYVIFVGSEGKK
jgi:HAE1 family hydrophobic/amphiphilic exporter-1